MKWFYSRKERDLDLIRVGMIAEQVKVKNGLSNYEITSQIMFAHELGRGKPAMMAKYLRSIKVHYFTETTKPSSKIKFEDVFDPTYRDEINKSNASVKELIEQLQKLKEAIK